MCFLYLSVKLCIVMIIVDAIMCSLVEKQEKISQSYIKLYFLEQNIISLDLKILIQQILSVLQYLHKVNVMFTLNK